MAAIILCLFLIQVSLLGCYTYSLSSTFLTSLLLVISTSFPFIFSKIRQLRKPSYTNEPSLDILPEDVSSEDEGLVESDSPLPEDEVSTSGGSLVAQKKLGLETVGHVVPFLSYEGSIYGDDEKYSSPELAYRSYRSSEGSISDEDNLIEITLPEGHYVAPATVHQDLRREVSLPADLSPESSFRQYGLMELFSEICEEENLIEIDIAMGSIKCSSLELVA